MVKLILDTDMGCDCDDAGAMAVMHRLADNGECEILAVTQTTSRISGAACVDAINRYYGRDDIPIGNWLPPGFLDEEQYEVFTRRVAEKFPHRYKDGVTPEDALLTLRRILAAAEDKSVTIVTVGQLNNMAALITSQPDKFSPLNGVELVRQKVALTVTMGGHFPETSPVPLDDDTKRAEFNIACDSKAARTFSSLWSAPIVYSPFEVGIFIMTGKKLLAQYDDCNPVRMSYKLYCDGERHSWDQTAVLYAVRGAQDFYTLSADGVVTFDEEGLSYFHPEPHGRDRYLLLTGDKDKLAHDIEQLML